MSLFINRVRFFTTSTGTGDLLVGSAYNGTFFTPAESGATNGQPYTWVITRDNDVEITVANYSTASGGTIVRSAGTTLISRIGGTVGTAKIDLPAGTTEVHIDAAAEDLLSMTTTRTANTLLGGPSSGGAAVPSFRVLVDDDMPAGLYGIIPVNPQSTAYPIVLADQSTLLLHPSSDNNARTFTIPSNGSIPFPVGTTITFANQINVLSIAITSDTLTWYPVGSTGTRQLAANGLATAVKLTTTSWAITGAGLS